MTEKYITRRSYIDTAGALLELADKFILLVEENGERRFLRYEFSCDEIKTIGEEMRTAKCEGDINDL